ncbi:hypothetical protein [Cytobacillus gottheilii]|uniref:hypothetical protein n=1 Tax=Cytobacillus gottheilii TaxID=859144 RepID=UPI0008363582|nr:hypothetical protein [Cytobacillus gottheilii]
MEFFEFTFNVGDTFEHKYNAIEKYVNRNIKKKRKLEWRPRINIQVVKDRTTVHLEKDLYDLNRVYNQTLYIQVLGGVTLYNHVSLNLKYQADEKSWLVTYVNNSPFAGWRNLS